MASPVGVPFPAGVSAVIAPFICVPSIAATLTSTMPVTPPAQSSSESVYASGNDFIPQEIELCVAVTTASSDGTTICHLVVVLPAGAPSGMSIIEPDRSSTIKMSAALGVGLNCSRPQFAVPASLMLTSPPLPVVLTLPPVPVVVLPPEPTVPPLAPLPPVPLPIAPLPPSPATLCTG